MDNPLNPPAEILFEQAPPQKFPWINVALFGVTCLSTMLTGCFLNASFANSFTDVSGFVKEIVRSPSLLVSGLPFSLAIMTILLGHEMGHYLTCRYYGIQATLPYFIPAPTIIGTMGAFIRIRSPIVSRRALFDVGIAGPLAGFVVALPVLIFGVAMSREAPVAYSGSSIIFGDPLLIRL